MCLQRKCKLKQEWHTTTHLLEWSKSRTLTRASVYEDGEKWKLSFNHTGNAEIKFLWKKIQKLLPKVCTCSGTLLLKRIKKLCTHKNLYTNIHLDFTHIAKTWKKPRCTSSGERIHNVWYTQTILQHKSNPWKDMEET